MTVSDKMPINILTLTVMSPGPALSKGLLKCKFLRTLLNPDHICTTIHKVLPGQISYCLIVLYTSRPTYLFLLVLLYYFIFMKKGLHTDGFCLYAMFRLASNLSPFVRNPMISKKDTYVNYILTFKRRIKSHLSFAGIIRSSPYSPRFQDNG